MQRGKSTSVLWLIVHEVAFDCCFGPRKNFGMSPPLANDIANELSQ